MYLLKYKYVSSFILVLISSSGLEMFSITLGSFNGIVYFFFIVGVVKNYV